jgi:2-polyprenyl-3-methyl-5-hydroxy-6-metoxy-1,4-benzoquinol methylase
MDGTTVSPAGAENSALAALSGGNGCRACGAALQPFVDLGLSPPCENFTTVEQLTQPEVFYPLDVQICPRCWLGQLREYVSPVSIFTEYAYFSSFSEHWLAHARDYVAMAVSRFGLGPQSFVVEVASNDGYLLRNVVARGIPCLGIEPAVNVAEAAQRAGVPTLVAFFGRALATQLAAEGRRADLIAGNNVLAQVPDLNDFVAGLALLLKPEGVITLEFPHLARLIAGNQFDTIYHEHFSYFSLVSVERLFAAHGLRLFDVEELWTHGGSLRVYGCHTKAPFVTAQAVARLCAAERAAGLYDLATYAAFAERVRQIKHDLLMLLIDLRRKGARIAGYGAPGKGNTLLNYCGIRTDLLEFTVDRNPYKWGRFLPGTRIPIRRPEELEAVQPDYVLILPWNLRDEIARQLAPLVARGTRLIVPIPRPEILT